jgi:hypothetical protein
MTMKLTRFLNQFVRVVSTNPKDPTICFYIGEREVQLHFIQFDVEANIWKVQLGEKKKTEAAG